MRINHSKAFTLTELIIASMVVGIIMLGIVTSNVAIQRNSKDFTASYFVIQKTSKILNHIITSAELAVGTPSEPGIVGVTTWDVRDNEGNAITDPGTDDPNTFCIHQNIASNAATWPGTPDINRNRWLCYTWIPTGGNAFNIYWCSKLYNSALARNGAAACSTADHFLEKAKSISTKFSISSYCTTGTTPCDVPQKVLFEVTINNCLDPTQTATCTSGYSENPYVQKIGNISPPGHSAG